MNLYGIENRNTIGKAIKIADRKTTLNSLECNLYKHKGGGYTIFAYNNAIAYNGDNVYSDDLGAIAYQCKNYGNANVYKVDVEKIEWKNRK